MSGIRKRGCIGFKENRKADQSEQGWGRGCNESLSFLPSTNKRSFCPRTRHVLYLDLTFLSLALKGLFVCKRLTLTSDLI
jgi:hypothetical protein